MGGSTAYGEKTTMSLLYDNYLYPREALDFLPCLQG